MKKTLAVLLLFTTFLSVGQETKSWPGKFFPGYSSSVRGGNFQYHSPQPDVNSSLLIRSIDSLQYIEWQTATVPADFKESFASFIWIFGIDANNDSHRFRLFLNGKYCLTFSNPLLSGLKPWTVEGNGCILDFRTTMLDKYDDPMGYAILKVPASLLEKGKEQTVRIVGESARSRSWYMTFEAAVKEDVKAEQEEVVIRGENRNYYSLLFHMVHLGEAVNAEISVAGLDKRFFVLQPGYNSVRLLVPESGSNAFLTGVISVEGKKILRIPVKMHDVRHWTIYLVQHAHTDIGYTRPQTEILPEHLRYIDFALDYCDQTDSLPDDAKFRWTCETSWAVREYIRTRPQSQVDRLRKRVEEGRIEITALFLNSSDLQDEASVASTLQPIKFFRENGFKVQSAQQDDINGVPWCLADYLPGAGINYLSMGQNAARALKPFDRPTVFWWESPAGNMIMVNRADHYMTGDMLGILTNAATFGESLFRHLQEIASKGYPFEDYAIHFSGYLTDNSPPSTTACNLVEEWNKKYVWPKLRLAILSEFPERLRQSHSSEMPVIRGAWPDWWMDGFGSAALETAYARYAHSDFVANTGLLSIAKMMGVGLREPSLRLLPEITDDLAFYDEHTFGAAESISDPRVENSVVQWNEKRAFAWDAVKKNGILREETMGLIRPLIPSEDVPVIAVFNTQNFPVSGTIRIYADHQVIPRDHDFMIVDATGKEVPVQPLESREDGTYWAVAVKDIPPMGYKTFRIQVLAEPAKPLPEKDFDGTLENQWYRIRFSPDGRILSILDKEMNLELTDSAGNYLTGDCIYERLGKNREQLDQLRLVDFTRTVWSGISHGKITEGPVWKSVTLSGILPECADEKGIRCEIRLYNDEKKIGFCYSMIKMPVTDPEGLYVSFPFRLPDSHLVYQVAGGEVVPGKNQIEGSATDWDGIRDYVAVRNNNSQIIFVSPEIPIVQLGAINLGNFARKFTPESTSIYSWVLNNYWTTNFVASQEGALKWNYMITSTQDTTPLAASRFGNENRIQLLTCILPASGKKEAMTAGSLSVSCLENLILLSARPAAEGKNIILQLREPNGKETSINISELLSQTNSKGIVEVNVLDEKVSALITTLKFKPFETKFLRLEY